MLLTCKRPSWLLIDTPKNTKALQALPAAWAIVATKFGDMFVYIVNDQVVAAHFVDDGADVKRLAASYAADAPRSDQAVIALLQQPEIEVVLQGTKLQQLVWSRLAQIPEGEMLTYSQVAALAGHDKAVRAVASAIGANVVAGLIPCHRVVRKSGELGGYRWGVERKAQMLGAETQNQFALI